MGRNPRLDEELVSQGFFSSADEAARAVMEGLVSTSSSRLEHPGQRVKPGIELHVKGARPYVGRGALKLEGALDALDVDVRGRFCLDVGCSTGGFTNCLLSRGAARVLAVDVGYAQFDWRLRNDSRVTLRERTNISDVPDEKTRSSIDLAVCDVSFTSVGRVLPAVLELLKPAQSDFITLVKPQFEAAREEVGVGGVVRDSGVWASVLQRVGEEFVQAGLLPLGACPSPIRGHKGNTEFFLWGRRGDGIPADGLAQKLELVATRGVTWRSDG